MKYEFISVFKTQGILVPEDQEDVVLASDASRDARAVLTNRPDEMCYECDRGKALANLMMMRLFNSAAFDLTDADASNAAIEKRGSSRNRVGDSYGLEAPEMPTV